MPSLPVPLPHLCRKIVLSGLLNEADRDSHLGGFSCTKLGPKVSHLLFFADDILLFCRPTLEECFQVKKLLAIYENMLKSAITFSKNVKVELRDSIQLALGLNSAKSHDKYLGLPMAIGRGKNEAFRAIKEKV